ncbi:MAG: mechanosensitive ion channel family protein [Bacteroidales bacterium]|nr:mechanosensitive ion channel family protein [Bacteroidales bacterium]MCF8402633.1 mechanosensitive ion channel family protein [Bacteroidales bacterium]
MKNIYPFPRIKTLIKISFLISFLLFGLINLGQTVQSTPPLQQILDTLEATPKSNAELNKADSAKKEAQKPQVLKPPSVTDVVSVPKIIWTIIFTIIGYFVIRLLIGLLNRFSIRYPRYEFTIKRIIPIFRIFAWVFVIYVVVVGIFNPPAATMLAFFASVGVAVGFAAQDLLKNVFGGLVVMFDRPFQIGDKIEAGKYYGEVIEIGIRSTKIVTPDDSAVTVPNSEFMIQYVSNSNSGENNCQVVAEMYLPIDIDTERVRQIATEAAQISKYIFLNKPIVVLFFNEFHDRRPVLKMRLKAYVSALDKEFAFKSEMTEIVIKSLLEEGIIKAEFYLAQP